MLGATVVGLQAAELQRGMPSDFCGQRHGGNARCQSAAAVTHVDLDEDPDDAPLSVHGLRQAPQAFGAVHRDGQLPAQRF